MPEQGSVGASGDLAPLAHLALPLIGRGEVEVEGRVVPAADALRDAGLEPLTLEPKEGLALLNGTQLMSALGALIAADGERLLRTASVAAAMSVEALLGTEVAFSAPYQLARPHPGQVAVAAELRHLLRGSGLQRSHHGSAHKVQDPYSLRCVPQVHGAVRDALDHLRRVLDIELNSATDNPLVFPLGGSVPEDALATGGGLVISGGNFHGEPIALALDFAKLALAELGSISERRTALLLDAPAQRRPARVPVARPRPEQRADARPVHRGGARVREQGARPPVVGRTRSRRPRTRRTTSRWAPPPRATRGRCSGTSSRSSRSSCCARPRRWTCGWRRSAADGDTDGTAGRRSPARASRRRGAASVTGIEPLGEDREPGPGPRGGARARARRDARGPRRSRIVDFAAMAIRIVDVTDDASFALLPPCADPGFDHRSCDYWEDADRGSKAARLSWIQDAPASAAAGAPKAREPVRP